MTDLYLIFFVVGLVLFAGIVLYSYLQQKRRNAMDDPRLIKPALKPTSSKRSKDKTATAATKQTAEIEPTPSVKTESVVQSAASLRSKLGAGSNVKSAKGGAKDDSVETDSPPPSDANLTGTVASDAAKKTPSPTAPEPEKMASSERANDSTLEISNTQEADKEPSSLSALKRARAALSGITRNTQEAEQVPNGAQPSKREPTLAAGKENAENERDSDTVDAGKADMIATADNIVLTDLVARVLNPMPVEQSDLLSLFREHDFKFHRKVHIYGLNELTDMWRDIEFELPSARFLELGISIQLCDREGAMSEKELHDFQQMVLQFCEKYDAPFEFSMEVEDALQQAQALDQIGRRYDSMAVLNVVPKAKTGFRMADIQSCARDLMMSSDKKGIFMKTEGQKNNITVLYRLACTDGEGHFGIQATGQALATAVHDLVVYMNVPATREPEIVFQQMVKDANDLAVWLDGKVVDRSGKAMTQRSYSTLMQQISDIAYSMQQDGLVPGDAVAKKLF